MGRFRQGLIAALLFLAALLLADPASADDAETCTNSTGDEAIEACTRAVASGEYDGNNIAILMTNRGVAYRAKGDYDRAIADFDEAIRLNPQYALAFNNRGLTYHAKGNNDRAIADYDEAIRLNPQEAIFYNRGLAYSQKGDRDRAIADYDQVIRLNPGYRRAYFERGRLYLYSGTYAKAQSDFKQASDLDPSNAYLALWLDIAERRNNSPSHLAQAVKRLDMKAWPAPVVRLFLGEMTQAAVLAAADDKNPETKRGQVCEVNFFGGELALTKRKKDEAIRLFRSAAKNCPKSFIEWYGAMAELKALGITP